MSLTCTTEEINSYLSRMHDMLDNPESKLIYLDDRDKNFTFAYLYSVTKSIVREVLLSITESEFYEKVESTNGKFKGHTLYAWNPVRVFVDARGEKREIELYVKTDMVSNDKLLFVVSFHKIDDF